MTTYEVIGNEPVTMSSPTGGFESGRKMTIRTDEGTIGVKRVPDSLSNDEVRKILFAEAQRLNDLNGPG